MDKRTFFSFSEASNFARQHAQETGVTLRLEKQDHNWVVYANQRSAPSIKGQYGSSGRQPWLQQQIEQQQRDLEREKERAVQEQIRRDLEQRIESESRERRSYLKEKEKTIAYSQ
jgi:hypothetical protein